MIIGSTVEHCAEHGKAVYVIVEIKNSNAKVTIKLCKLCLERSANEKDY